MRNRIGRKVLKSFPIVCSCSEWLKESAVKVRWKEAKATTEENVSTEDITLEVLGWVTRTVTEYFEEQQ